MARSNLQKISHNTTLIKTNLIPLIVLTGLLLLNCINCFATDILQGAEQDVFDTLGGTGKTLIYLAEVIVATISYVKTRNIMVFVGTAVVFIAFNFLFKMVTG